MDIDTQRLTKSQFVRASRYQKIQQATLNESLRGLSTEYDILRHQTASEAARMKLKADSLQELACRSKSGGQRLLPHGPSRSNTSLQASTERLSVSMNDINQATLFGEINGCLAQGSRGAYSSSARCSSNKRTQPRVGSTASDIVTRGSSTSRGVATFSVPQILVSPDAAETVVQFDALKKCRYLRVAGLNEEPLSLAEVFATSTDGEQTTAAPL